MKNIIKFLLFIILFELSFSKILFANEKSASVFVYHRFGENSYPSTNIKMNQFKKHIKELTENNYNIIPLNELVDSLINKKDLPEKTIALTADDAFLSIYKNAWPIIKEKKIPFTIFVSTGPVDTKSKNYMNWQHIIEMVNNGLVTIGNHTKNHLHLVNHDYEKTVNEIEEANKSFLKNLGFEPEIFAYPYGEFKNENKEIAKKYFKAAFGQQSGTIFDGIDMYNLPRFSLNEQYGDIKRFKFAANSYGLKIKDIIPNNRIINKNNPPLLGFTLIDNIESDIKCYPSHNIKADINKLGKNRIEVRFNNIFPKGRTRINCTTNDKGKWRWYGFQFFNP
tara:strand:+ start:631 stop:1641 length:1011 start_codon:yes stop_codon:yes gene_type:complete